MLRPKSRDHASAVPQFHGVAVNELGTVL